MSWLVQRLFLVWLPFPPVAMLEVVLRKIVLKQEMPNTDRRQFGQFLSQAARCGLDSRLGFQDNVQHKLPQWAFYQTENCIARKQTRLNSQTNKLAFCPTQNCRANKQTCLNQSINKQASKETQITEEPRRPTARLQAQQACGFQSNRLPSKVIPCIGSRE